MSKMYRQSYSNYGPVFENSLTTKRQIPEASKGWGDLQLFEWGLICESLTSILCNVGFQIYFIVLSFTEEDISFVFPALVIIGNSFAVYFLINGIFKEIPFPIMMQLAVKSTVWILGLLNFLSPAETTGPKSIHEKTSEIQFYISSGLLPLSLLMGSLVLYHYWKSKTAVYRMVGTAPKYVAMCQTLLLAYNLIGFDIMMSIISLTLLSTRPLDSEHVENSIILPVGIVFIIAWTIFGIVGIRRESKTITNIFYVVCMFQPAYVIFLMLTSREDDIRNNKRLLHLVVYVVGSITIASRLLLLIVVKKVQSNFGRGLKEILQDREAFETTDTQRPLRNHDSLYSKKSVTDQCLPRSETSL